VPPELGMARSAAAPHAAKVVFRVACLHCRPLRARSHLLGRCLSVGPRPFSGSGAKLAQV
jgi:hypothetical protein